MNSPFYRHACVLAAAVLLGGCYESNVKVLNYGDKVNISGTYTCTSLAGILPDQSVTISESFTGSGDKVDYRYQVQDGGMFQFAEMDLGFYLGQTLRGNRGWGRRERDARYGFVFVDVIGSRGFTIHEAKFKQSKTDIDDAAENRTVGHKHNPDGRGTTHALTGTADNIFEFLNDHRQYMLTATASCTRAD